MSRAQRTRHVQPGGAGPRPDHVILVEVQALDEFPFTYKDGGKPGTRARTHGEASETDPAVKATGKLTSELSLMGGARAAPPGAPVRA